MKFYKAGGWWLPDGDELELRAWLERVNRRSNGRLLYQDQKYLRAQEYIKRFGAAIDVGAHVGLWSFMLAHDFRKVTAFEPVHEHVECWRKNLAEFESANIREFALGDEEKLVRITNSSDSILSAVGEAGQLAKMRPLDSFKINHVDFLKVDCEGYELFVLRGARELLKRCRPCVIVEQKPQTVRYGVPHKAAVDFLIDMGAKVRVEMLGDYILSWD